MTKTESGDLDQLIYAIATGVISASFWGLFIGVLLGSLARAASNGASGTLGCAFTEMGLNHSFDRKLAVRLRPAKGALVLLIKLMVTDEVLKEIESFGSVLLKTSIDEEQVLRNALRFTNAGNHRCLRRSCAFGDYSE